MLSRTIIADFSKRRGRIKPLSGICLGPRYDTLVPLDFSSEYRELGIPYVRPYSTCHSRRFGFSLDLARIFPDPMLDERFPESYDFSEADKELSLIKECGASIYLSIGGVPHGDSPAAPHTPWDKWARIAEKVILHYNRGWGGGFKYSVKLVEIWPGADMPQGFLGGARAYAEFYTIVSSHLKSVYPTLKLGAYSSGGFSALNHYGLGDEEQGYVRFLEQFLADITSRGGAPVLDFFSWRADVESAEELSLHGSYARNYLLQYGLRRTLSVVSELSIKTAEPARLSRAYPALLASVLMNTASAPIDMMLYSTGYPYSLENALFTSDDCLLTHRYSAFGVMAAYGELLRHGTEVETTENFRHEIYSLAAVSDGGGALLISTGSYSGTLSIEIAGSSFSYYSIKGMLGGGKRGEGYSTEERNIPLGGGRFTMKVGKCEVYLISLFS